jgi:hypothetical protein
VERPRPTVCTVGRVQERGSWMHAMLEPENPERTNRSGDRIVRLEDLKHGTSEGKSHVGS